MTFELIPLQEANPDDINQLIKEADDAVEYCNVLWRLYQLGIDNLKLACSESQRCSETLLAFVRDDYLIAVARVSEKPKHIENGKVGLYVRPSERGKHYAICLIRMIQQWCEHNAIADITAAVDMNNAISLKAFESAGWERTGRQFKWNNGRTAIELKPIDSGS